MYWNLVLDIEDIKEFTTAFLPFYLGGINKEQKEFQMVFESAMDCRLQPMNWASLTSLYIPVREKRLSEAGSVHTTAQARATAAQSLGKGTGCRVRWYIQGPANIKGNVLQYGFTMYNTKRKLEKLIFKENVSLLLGIAWNLGGQRKQLYLMRLKKWNNQRGLLLVSLLKTLPLQNNPETKHRKQDQQKLWIPEPKKTTKRLPTDC